MIPRERERLEAIERVLEELRVRDPRVAIIVEGNRDLVSLKNLKVPEPIVKLNVGSSLLNFCEEAAREYDGLIILTDWDPKGEQLAKRLEQYLGTTGVPVDIELRRRLGRLLPFRLHEVESLASHVERLRRAATQPGGEDLGQRPPL